MEELDRILEKYTSDSGVTNPLKGVSFTAFTKHGGINLLHSSTLAAIQGKAIELNVSLI